ncbi:MAG: phosphatase PAP2 family protein [bacterium]|nr:phosphatase PAP2 family protein [bacterium]
MKTWGTMAAMCALLLVSAGPVEGQDQGAAGSERQLRVIRPDEPVPILDPAFEMIMEKVDKDLKYVLSSPVRVTPRNTALTGLTVLTTLFLLNHDEDYAADIIDTRDDRNDKMYERFRVLSRHVPETTAGLYLLGYFLDDKELKSRSLAGFEALAITALISASSGFIVGHEGPGDSPTADQFDPFNRYHSMPDISSSLVFSVASVFAYEAPWHQALFYYALAAGTAVSRVYHEDAWPSDVFLGSVIGTAIGRTIAGRSRRNGREPDFTLIPVLEHHGRAAAGIKVEWKL